MPKPTEPKAYRVVNPLLSVRRSRDPKSPLYGEFLDWPAGALITDFPQHAASAIAEWLAAGHIVEEV